MPNRKVNINVVNQHLKNMNLSLVSTYRNLGKRTSVICNSCGLERNVCTGSIVQENCRCPSCSQYTRSYNRKRTESDYERDFEKKNENFTFIKLTEEGYLECKCNFCGATNIFKDVNYAIHNEITCSHCRCSESWNENYVTKVFDNQNIWYEKQKKFKDLGEKRFDFYLPYINACLEIQGEQHYGVVKFKSNVSDYERTKKSDEIKKKYCEEHGIKLFIIDARGREKFKNRIWDFVYNNDLGLN